VNYGLSYIMQDLLIERVTYGLHILILVNESTTVHQSWVEDVHIYFSNHEG
jgi:hypothetical protein